MAVLIPAGQFCLQPLSKSGYMGIVYVKSSQHRTYSSKLNVAAYKRGTGGRSSFNGMVATVFGCTGFVGRYLCNKLGKIGTQLILPYRCDHYDCMKLKVVGDLGQVLFCEFDVRDEQSIATAIRHSNVVINLIGRDYETKNFKYKDVHVDAARRIAKISRECGVERFIHLSYLNAEEKPVPLLLRKPSMFKITKYLGEVAVREEFPEATIIRASDIYGTEDRFTTTLVSNWRRQLHNVPLYARGEKTVKQPIFVSDVAQAIVNAAQDASTKGQCYQAVGPKRYLLGDLVDWFQGLMRKDEKWGYKRHDMKFDPTFTFKVNLINMVSPQYPFGNLHWEGLEKESTTDVVVAGQPTIEDLGVLPAPMENEIPWLLKPYRAYQYYIAELGEFPTPPPPKVYNG